MDDYKVLLLLEILTSYADMITIITIESTVDIVQYCLCLRKDLHVVRRSVLM